MTTTACTPSEPPPTGDALEAAARAHYEDYRSLAPIVQAELVDGPWVVSQGQYGAVPFECDADGSVGYRFELVRTVDLPVGTDHDAVLAAAADALDADGVAARIATVGPVQQLRAEDPVRGNLLVELYPRGAVVVSVDSPCWPGDSAELMAIMFPDAEVGDSRPDYVPLTESPTDAPIFRFTGPVPESRPQTPADVVTDD